MFVISEFGINKNAGEEQNIKKEISAKEKVEQSQGAYLKCEKREEILKKLGDCYIRIQKPQNVSFPVELEDCYQQGRVRLYMYQMLGENISFEDLQLVYTGENSKKVLAQFKKETSISYELESNNKNTAILSFSVDKIYGYCLYEDEQYIYIACKKPSEVYDKIIVLDAGHGGKDTGTDALSGNWSEADYNLDFVKKIEQQWSEDDAKLYLTRWDDTKVSLKKRVEFANALSADYFVSIHCNSSDETGGYGLEALYKTNQYKTSSKQMARTCLEQLSFTTGMPNRGALNGQSIYIIRNAKMPTVLLEMGFLTDKGDLAYLKKEENRTKMAEAVCSAIRKGMKQ